MKQIGKNTLCYYCLGCKEESIKEEEKPGKNFVPGIENWQDKLREELKKSEQIQK